MTMMRIDFRFEIEVCALRHQRVRPINPVTTLRREPSKELGQWHRRLCMADSGAPFPITLATITR